MRLLLLLVGLPLLAQNPAHFAAMGLGLNARTRATTGWFNICEKTTESVYLCAANDTSAGSSTWRAGLETIVAQWGVLTVTLKADAGASTTSLALGGSYGAGESVLLDVSKWLKAPNVLFAASVSYSKSNVADGRPNTTIRFGFGRTF